MKYILLIANFPDGNSAALHCFLPLLCQTSCPTSLGIIQPYWAKITIFHCNPTHFMITKLPWDLHDLFAELEASDVSILTSHPSNSTSPFTLNDDYDSNNNSISPIAAFGASTMDVTNTSSNNNIISSSTSPIAALGITKFTTNNISNNNKTHQHHRLSPNGCPYPP